MAALQLNVKQRQRTKQELVAGREAGMIPAVLYGHGVTPEMFWVQYLDFSKMYDMAGESSIVSLLPEGGKATSVLIHDVQLDPITNRFSHIDFFQVRMDEKLEAHIPLEFTGEAPAVRESGGVLVKTLEEVSVWCLPKDLPHSIPVDISILKTFDDQIKVKNLPVDKGVEILTEAETVIALVEAPRTEAELEALSEKVEVDVTKVEGVIKEPPVTEGVEEKA